MSGHGNRFTDAAKDGGAALRCAALVLCTALAGLGGCTTATEPQLGTADPVEATQWFRVAAEQGHHGAQSALAEAYLTGSGVPVDVDAGHFWLLVLGDAAGDSDRRARAAMSGKTPASHLALLQARAAAWQPGRPGMPYASGNLAYQPLQEADELLRPYATWTLRDAAAAATPDGWLLLLSPYPVDRPPQPSGLGSNTGLLLLLDQGRSLHALLLHDESGYIELDPDAFQLSIQPHPQAIQGTISNRRGSTIETARAWINARFTIPLALTETR